MWDYCFTVCPSSFKSPHVEWMEGRGEAVSTCRGRVHFTPHGSASGPRHYRVETAVRAGFVVCRWAGRGPHRISSSPVPQTPPRRGCWKNRRLRLARAARPSALIPDTLMGRWRRRAGAAKKIIRSFELRLLASLSATMNPEMISMIVTMNGRWSRGQSRSAQPGEFDARATGGAEQQQRVVILTTGGDPGACVRLSVRFCEPLWSRAERRWGEERSGGGDQASL